MTENDRIRIIRKDKGLTMEAFGERLGVAKSTISGIESGARTVTNQVRTAIIREYDVNETWLRTGEGEMYIEKDLDTQLADFFGAVLADKPDAFRRRLASALAKMSEAQWAALADIADTLLEDK